VVVEAGDAPAAVEVASDTHVIDTRHAHGMIDVIDEVPDGDRRVQAIDFFHPFLKLLLLLVRGAAEIRMPST